MNPSPTPPYLAASGIESDRLQVNDAGSSRPPTGPASWGGLSVAVQASTEGLPMYIGSTGGMERKLVPRTGMPCFFFPMAPPRSARGVLLLAFAMVRSILVMLRHRPRATLATGGYVSTPVSFASWLLRVPVILFLPDIVPGRAVRWLAPLSTKIAVATVDAAKYLPATKTVVTGYPVRAAFLKTSRADGRTRFSLPADARVVCVFGGSQGSRTINQALAASLPRVLREHWVLHICGEKRADEARAATSPLPDEFGARYLLFPYLHDDDMALALAAADLAVCRSGASTIGELPMTGTPAILVPLPEQGVHQRANARYLADAGAGIIADDATLQLHLGDLIVGIFQDPARLEAMSAACRSLARPDAAERIAALVADVRS